jgi:hypothetical protein
MKKRRCRSVFVVEYDAATDAEALSIARSHVAQIVDLLEVEGADNPYNLVLEHVYADEREILQAVESKSMPTKEEQKYG